MDGSAKTRKNNTKIDQVDLVNLGDISAILINTAPGFSVPSMRQSRLICSVTVSFMVSTCRDPL
jgi:hypothetical protein